MNILDAEKVSELVRSSVNVHGELHLDKIRTQLLIDWLNHQEKFIAEIEIQIEELRSVFPVPEGLE